MALETLPKSSGYRNARSFGNTWVNGVGALILICLTLPFFAVIPMLIKLSDGGPVFYRSLRLGFNKKPFWMYKFRSLRVDAHQALGSELFNERHKLETPIGSFMRDTRLDELPQLFNVLKGDMDLIGPRPERPEVYERYCQWIRGYDLRFQIRPGVIGYAQLFTPHATPKRLRSLIDTHFVMREHKTSRDFWLLGHAAAALAFKMVQVARAVVVEFRQWFFVRSKHPGQRQVRRVFVRDAQAYLAPVVSGGGEELACRLLNLSQEAILVDCASDLVPDNLRVRLTCFAANARWRQRKLRTVRCVGRTLAVRVDDEKGAATRYHVIQIRPLTPLNEFKLYKYFLQMSIS